MRATDVRAARRRLALKEDLLRTLETRYPRLDLAVSDVSADRRLRPHPDAELRLVGRLGPVTVVVPVELYGEVAVVDGRTAAGRTRIELGGRVLGPMRRLTEAEMRSLGLPARPPAPIPSPLGDGGVHPVDWFDWTVGAALHALLRLARDLGAAGLGEALDEARWTLAGAAPLPDPYAQAVEQPDDDGPVSLPPPARPAARAAAGPVPLPTASGPGTPPATDSASDAKQRGRKSPLLEF